MTASTPTLTKVWPRTLNRTEDRCDYCGAEAMVSIEMNANGSELLFCGHHYTSNEASLAGRCMVTNDSRPGV